INMYTSRTSCAFEHVSLLVPLVLHCISHSSRSLFFGCVCSLLTLFILFTFSFSFHINFVPVLPAFLSVCALFSCSKKGKGEEEREGGGGEGGGSSGCLALFP